MPDISRPYLSLMESKGMKIQHDKLILSFTYLEEFYPLRVIVFMQ